MTDRRSPGAVVVAALLALAGCASVYVCPPLPAGFPAEGPIPEDRWFAERAAALGLDEAGARARDAAIGEDAPPRDLPGYGDAMVRVQAARTWATICSSCHGADGSPPPAVEGARGPRDWSAVGPTFGFLFGGDSMRASLYRRIRAGGEAVDGVPSAMPAWGEVLSREETWALVDLIESF